MPAYHGPRFALHCCVEPSERLAIAAEALQEQRIGRLQHVFDVVRSLGVPCRLTAQLVFASFEEVSKETSVAPYLGLCGIRLVGHVGGQQHGCAVPPSGRPPASRTRYRVK